MERAAWTNERLDDLAESMRTGFARVDQDIRDLRSEMHAGFGSVREELSGQIGSVREELNGQIGSVREELKAQIGSVREELNGLRTLMLQFAGVMVVGFISVLAAILARGV